MQILQGEDKVRFSRSEVVEVLRQYLDEQGIKVKAFPNYFTVEPSCRGEEPDAWVTLIVDKEAGS